ncbi:MAG: helix-turn-helix domain-containing protein [Bacteroides sp.]|nr:helix-turn-helix domain-containing protein [Bacteroides sp.]
MKYEELISAFGVTYLKGDITHVKIDRKFYMLDNLSDSASSPVSGKAGNIRYPVCITLSFCIYCKQGNISARVQQKDYSVGAGEILVIFAEQILEYASLSDDCKVIFFAIDSEYVMTELRSRYRESFRHWLLRSKDPLKMHLSMEDAANFEQLCMSIKHIVKASGSESADGVISGFTAIIGNLLLLWGVDELEGNLPDKCMANAESVMLRFKSDIHSFSARFRSVSYYARRQNLSVRHFSRLVKEASGQRPLEIIRDYVILEAKSLLITERYNVREVAEKLGFQNDSFFNRYFRNAAGLTPGEFMAGENAGRHT